MYLFSVIGLLFLLLMGSIFSAFETACIAVSEYKLISIAKRYRYARYALLLKKNLNKVLIFSLFGNSLFNTLLATLATMLVTKTFGENQMVLSFATLVVTFMIIIFSEATPKIIATKSPLTILRILAIPAYYLFLIAQPMIWLIDKIVYFITRLFNVGNSDGTSLDELRAIVTDKRSQFQESHRSIVLNSLELQGLVVREVIIPLRNVKVINLRDSPTIIYTQLINSHHTRIIVYEGSIDNILGYLHVKDILGLAEHKFNLAALKLFVRPISYVPDFVPIIKQLSLVRKSRERIFIAVNEYGDILGIACLDDMLEIVFGDFTTSSPHGNYLIIKESENNYIVDGATLIREFNEEYSLQLPIAYDAMSMNGLIIKYLRAIPNVGVCFRIDNVSFEVLQMGKFWVERVRISVVDN